MTDSEIIDRLGGTASVAKALGLTQPPVSLWRTRGISWQYRPKIAELAKAQSLRIPEDFLTQRRGGQVAQNAA